MTKGLASHRLLSDGRLDLPEITLFAASSKALPATTLALRKCLAQLRPADAILFSDAQPTPEGADGFRFVRTDRMESREDYSNFILKELVNHISTDFVLCVQWDGYVLNAQNWSDDFLGVDYVGAPWPQFDDGHAVGNGGFSLRSRRLLEACADDRLGKNEIEDVAICRSARPWLESDYGIRFADRDLACRFSYERTPPRGDEFGFHGVFNMMDILPRPEYREIVESLEAGVLRQSDRLGLMRCALRRCDFKTVQVLLTSKHTGRLVASGTSTLR